MKLGLVVGLYKYSLGYLSRTLNSKTENVSQGGAGRWQTRAVQQMFPGFFCGFISNKLCRIFYRLDLSPHQLGSKMNFCEKDLEI